MKWPSDFPNMKSFNGSPCFIGHEGLTGKFAYKDEQWFTIGKRKEGDVATSGALVDRDVELITDPAILAKLDAGMKMGKR